MSLRFLDYMLLVIAAAIVANHVIFFAYEKLRALRKKDKKTG